MEEFNSEIEELIQGYIQKLNLDLTGLNVLTEVGSNFYQYTPLIPLMAGAERVFVWSKDSSYGKSADVSASFREALQASPYVDRVEFAENERNFEHLGIADIITNSGAIRPIDSELLLNVRPGISIPLMYEKWEHRKEDVDLDAALKAEVRVAGTWENHPQINVFDFVSDLAVKMVRDSGVKIKGSRVLIFSSDEFGKQAEKGFLREGAYEVTIVKTVQEASPLLEGADFLYICDYRTSLIFDQEIVQMDGFKNTKIVHLYGSLNFQALTKAGAEVYPPKDGVQSTMSFTLAHLGPEPVVALQVAGLKVGVDVLKGKENSLIQPMVNCFRTNEE